MASGNHPDRVAAALRAFRGNAQGFKHIRRRLKHHFIIVDDQNVDRIELHIVSLSVGHRYIYDDGKRRSFALLALALYRSAHQIDHLFRDGETEPGPLDTVHAAVRLAGKRLEHPFHELRTHTDTGV